VVQQVSDVAGMDAAIVRLKTPACFAALASNDPGVLRFLGDVEPIAQTVELIGGCRAFPFSRCQAAGGALTACHQKYKHQIVS
jgi:hypothetical protein